MKIKHVTVYNYKFADHEYLLIYDTPLISIIIT